jgi:hypothetical protein
MSKAILLAALWVAASFASMAFTHKHGSERSAVQMQAQAAAPIPGRHQT